MNKETINRLKKYVFNETEDVKDDFQFVLNYITQLEKENERLKEIVDKTNNELITLIQIIIEWPSNNVEEDNYLLNRLEGISSILTGGS